MSKKKPKKAAVLHLNLHREFFARIASGEKTTEYRDRTEYWKTRLEKRQYDVIQFRNGYATDAPEMLVEFGDDPVVSSTTEGGFTHPGPHPIPASRTPVQLESWHVHQPI